VFHGPVEAALPVLGDAEVGQRVGFVSAVADFIE
jgi:hypothetical protein